MWGPVAIVVLAWASAAAAAPCVATGEAVPVQVEIRPGTVVYDNGHSRAQIGRLSQSRGQGSATSAGVLHGWEPVGLTTADTQFRLRAEVIARSIDRRRYCVHLESVDAVLGYDDLRVYVARRYRPGSCAHANVLDHENRHVSIFRTTLEQYAPRLRRLLVDSAARLGPVISLSPNDGARHLQSALQDTAMPLFEDMTRALSAAHAKLDTPENYAREQARCNDW